MNLANPLVSIIIPVYNSEEFLRETIASAISQTWLNKEILIIDDGSTDNSLNVAKKFESEGVKIYRQENRGASAARNYGIDVSKGDFIQFLDGDDIIPVDKIEKQLSVLLKNPNCVIGCNWVRFVSSRERTWGEMGPHPSIRCDLDPIEWLLKRHMMCVHAWLTPRILVTKAGAWNESLSYNDDGEFFCRVISKAAKVLFTSDVTVYYRSIKNRDSISKMNSQEKCRSAFLAATSYKTVISSVTNSVESKTAIGNYFKQLEFLFYPEQIELVKECKIQPEIHLANVKFDGGAKTNIAVKLLGWKLVKRIKFFLKQWRR